jgi:DNA-directed RNA polymerase subunit RPC12/RpoP
MKLLEFNKKYPTEESCKIAFKNLREQEGVNCSKCGNTTHYWKKNREQWECKKCSHRTTLKSGTVMHNSKLTFQTWFKAMTLISGTKKSFSAKEVQRQLGHNRYEPIWAMLHKLRAVMGMRDDLYTLKEQVELDEGFFETVDIHRDYEKKLKRGRGSERQTTVLVSAESLDRGTKDKFNKYSKQTKLRFVKMKVINSLKKEIIKSEAFKIIEKGSVIKSDGSNSYNDLKDDYKHQPTVTDKSKAAKLLPWVHTSISNAKKLLLDVHHRIDDDFLQNYLNEFCFKLNRRYFDCIFERLLIASVSFKWNSFGETYG